MKTILIGLGGIGGLMCLHLSKLTKLSPDSLVFIDGDNISPGNMDRQFFMGAGNKALAWANFLKRMPDFDKKILVFPSYFDADQDELIEDGDTVIVCVDNHYTRNLVDIRSRELANITIVSGGNEEFDGNAQWLVKKDGKIICGRYLSDTHPDLTKDKRPEWNEMQRCDVVKDNRQTYVANLAASTAMANAWWLILTEQYGKLKREAYFDTKELAIVQR